MEMNFCRRCGETLTSSDSHVFTCSNGHELFYNCTPTTGVFIITPDNKLLLSVRGIEPRKGMLDSFGGFVDGEESAEAAVARELTEELGITPDDYTTPRYLTSAIGHYPYKGEVIPVLSLFYWIRLNPDVTVIPQDDVADIAKMELAEVDYSQLHDKDIEAGVKALQAILL